MKHLKFTLIIIIGILSFQKTSFSQSEKDMDKMLYYYVDEEYEKLLKMSIGYTENEDTRRNPVPYIYVSKAYYEMSKIEEFDEEYPRAYRDAVKYAAKYRKKDKTGEFLEDNAEYIDGLKIQTFELADNYYQIGQYTKAKRYNKYLTGMDPEDWGSWFLRGVTEMRLNMRTDSGESIKTAMDGLSSLDKEQVENYLPGQYMLLKKGIIIYSEYMKELGKMSESKEVINLGYLYFENDNEYKITFDDIMRG
jgi:tetratricopeptide (TPR) repeat protein